MNKDTVVGIVGAALLVVAMIGVFKYEGSQAQSTLGSQAFDVTWATATANGPALDGTTPLEGATSGNLTVAQANLTQVKFTLTWTAQNGRDTLALTVTPPAGSGLQANSTSSDAGTLTLVFDVPNTVPEPHPVFGNSQADAERRLADQQTKRLGTGEWGVTVEFTDATGITGVLPVPGAPPVAQDEQVAWSLKTQLTHYAPALAKK